MTRLIGSCLMLLMCASAAVAEDGRVTVLQRFQMNPFHVNIGTIGSVKADGTVTVKEIANPRFILSRGARGKTDLTEGRYLGFVGKDFVETTSDTRLVSIRVVEVLPDNGAVVRVSAAAAKQIKAGEDLLLFRPPGATTAQLKSAPGYAKVDDGEKTTTVLGRDAVNVIAAMTMSRNNLKQIALALHNYHDTYQQFPPAVIYGPDGKPWHSWRVLILPYIEQQALYQQYRFDEPWNGPNNKKLLPLMPQVYSDPIHGKQDGNYFTHYAASTGNDAVFPVDGARMKNKTDRPEQAIKKAARIRDIRDGTSNTIMTGSVGPEHKIPWMKPADVVFDKTYPVPGTKGSFAAPYKNNSGAFGLFGRADGSVFSVPASVDAKTWQLLIQKADGNPIPELPGDQKRSGRGRSGKAAMQAVEIIRTPKGVFARLVSGPLK